MSTITVNLQNDWAAPDGHYYRKKNNPHVFPEDFEDILPKSAKKVNEPAPKPAPAPAMKPKG